jgi:hypothetical protein
LTERFNPTDTDQTLRVPGGFEMVSKDARRSGESKTEGILGRLLGLGALLLSLSVVQPAFARDNDDHHDNGHENDDRGERTSVPELSANGATSAFAVIAGGAAIVFGRRRRARK